ncbi:MAG TPA: TolC family protein [Candidatus Krumholzibacteria bacterium]|nr:TolC family protein [Candidatus Krumholzibacteria bacterium]
MRCRNPLAAACALLSALGLLAVPAPAATGPAAGDDLTFERVWTLVSEHSPRLAAAGFGLDASAAESRQAGRGPNPELAVTVENFGGSGEAAGFGTAEATVAVAQVLELGGKRAHRAEEARLAHELAGWDALDARWQARAAARAAFARAWAAQEAMSLADEVIATARDDSAAVHRRVLAGAATPVDLARARVAVASAGLDRRRRDAELAAARAALAATWGDRTPRFGRVVGDLAEVAAPPSRTDLEDRLADAPRLQRGAAAAARQQAAVAAAVALGTPDLTASAGYRRLGLQGDGDHAFVVGLSLPLPVRDTNRDGAAAARARLALLDAERRADQADAAAELDAALAELGEAFDEIATLREAILPAAAEAMGEARRAYDQGLFGLTDVAAVRMTFFDLRGREIDALARYHAAAARLSALVGDAAALDTNDEGRRP